MTKNTRVEEISKTMAFEKVSENSLLLYCLDMFTFQISIHTLKLMCQKSTPVGENIKQWPWRKYQTIAICYKVSIFLDSKYLFTHLIGSAEKYSR